MRLKDIPKGTSFVCFLNGGPDRAILTFKYPDGTKERAVAINSNSFLIIQASTFKLGLCFQEFPHIRVWSNQYVSMEIR